MYEHPYFTHQITRYEQEQMERAAALRRSLIEHADQIVPRPAGPLRRVLRRLFGRMAGRSTGRTVAVRTTAGASACDPAAAPAR